MIEETQTSERPQAPRGIFSAVGLAFAGRGGEVALAAVANVLIARILHAEGRGNLTTAITASYILYLLCEFGLRATITRVVAGGQATWREGIATLAVMYASVCAVVLPIGAWVLTAYHDRLFPGIPLAVLFLALFSIPVLMLEGGIAGVLAGHQRQPEVNFLRVLEKGCYMVALVGLVWVMRTGLVGAMLATLSSLLVGAVIGLMLLRRLPGGQPRVRTDLMPSIVRFGSVLYIGNLAMSLNYRLDALIVFTFLHSAPAGYYAIAVMLAEMVQYLPDTASSILFPSVSNDEALASQRTTRLTRVMGFLLLLSCLALIAVAWPVIHYIFGTDFSPAYLSMVLLLPGMLLLGLARIVVADISGRGHPQYGMMSAWIALIATVILDFLLIPSPFIVFGVTVPALGWGINGAAIASSIAYAISFIVLTTAYRRLTGISLRELYLPRAAELREMVNRLRAALLRRARPRVG